MTDKVQKIKEWISKEQDGLMDAQGNFENPSDEGAFHILTNLDYYIDSLQEEPKPLFNVGDIICNKQWKTAIHKIVSMDDKAYYLENGGKVEIVHQELWEVVREHVNNDLQEVPCDHCQEYNNKEKRKMSRDKEITKAALYYANNLEDVKLTDEFSKNLCIALGQVFMKGAEWADSHLWKDAQGDDLPEIDREVIALLDNGKVVFAHRPNPEGEDYKSLILGCTYHLDAMCYDKGGGLESA